jgi:hypothetical protein
MKGKGLSAGGLPSMYSSTVLAREGPLTPDAIEPIAPLVPLVFPSVQHVAYNLSCLCLPCATLCLEMRTKNRFQSNMWERMEVAMWETNCNLYCNESVSSHPSQSAGLPRTKSSGSLSLLSHPLKFSRFVENSFLCVRYFMNDVVRLCLTTLCTGLSALNSFFCVTT